MCDMQHCMGQIIKLHERLGDHIEGLGKSKDTVLFNLPFSIFSRILFNKR